MTKRNVKAALGFTTDAELARFLGCTRQALTRIGDDDLLPEGRQWQVRAMRPDVFGPAPAPAEAEGQRGAA